MGTFDIETYPMKREFHYRWEWRLQADPDLLWPLVSDTNRFNHDVGIPAVERRGSDAVQASNARRRLGLLRFGIPMEWDEEPFEWIRPHRFGVIRRFITGPVAEMRIGLELSELPEGGSRLIYQIWARPKNRLGFMAIPLHIGLLNHLRFEAVFRKYDQIALSRRPSPVEFRGSVHWAPGGRARLTKMRENLLAQRAAPDLVEQICRFIEEADDMTVSRMRPYALADSWERQRRTVLEHCLWSTRVGLLHFQWDVICPFCRGVKQTSGSLGGIQTQVHCEICNIDFRANFERAIELTFRPNPAVRPGLSGEFCVGGPQVTPHIVAQQLLPPGTQRELTLPLEEGRYRMRTLGLRGGQFLIATSEGRPNVTFSARDSGWPEAEAHLSLAPTLLLENDTTVEQLFILERMAWNDQALTAADVTTLQLFRDLFANEALRPGERISVGSLTVLFTDLRDSTRLYRELGDAVAFGQVLRHFDTLREAIESERGALVKTIGDSIMAAFVHPVAALRAILKAQRQLAHPPQDMRPLYLKVGMHYGPCIAVTLNDRLDYFGSTVNIAARLESLATSGGIVISSEVHSDPEVAEFLAQSGDVLRIEPFDTHLRGFGEECFTFWRVLPAEGAAASTAGAQG